MLRLPEILAELVHWLGRIPGVGPKSAERMALALQDWDRTDIEKLAAALLEAGERVSGCPQCGCLAQDGNECAVCNDPGRDQTLLCVVETALDAIALERGGGFDGRYHVLGGVLSPVKGTMPEDLSMAQLESRIDGEEVREVIIATNASPDGEATAIYLRQELAPSGVRLTRLARGLPSGGQLDYTDAETLQSALDNRREF